MLTDVHFAVEGPGSVPVKAGALTGRGMLNRGAELKRLGSYAELEGEGVVLFLASDRLTGVVEDSRVQVGAPDLAAANAVAVSDPTYRVVRRSPVDDGLIHALVLEGGAGVE